MGNALALCIMSIARMLDGAAGLWTRLITKNSPGTLPPYIPVLLAQGGADQLVQPRVTQDYMKRLCAAGSKWVFIPTVSQGFAADKSASAAVQWMADRFAGSGSPSDCGRQ